MHRQAVVAKKQHACCPGGASAKRTNETTPKGACKCKFKAPSDASPVSSQLIVPPVQVFAALPSVLPEPQARPVVVCTVEVLFHSDSSPPIVTRHPDLGRAPPVA